MAAIERHIGSGFTPIEGGYSRKIDDRISLVVPAFSVSHYDPETGDLYGYAPDYDALEAAKKPSVEASAPGEYSYYYEMQKAPTGCDFSADRSYYGNHFFLRPLRDDLPRLHGRGITYNAEHGDYFVTERAYEKLKTQYRIKREMCFD